MISFGEDNLIPFDQFVWKNLKNAHFLELISDLRSHLDSDEESNCKNIASLLIINLIENELRNVTDINARYPGKLQTPLDHIEGLMRKTRFSHIKIKEDLYSALAALYKSMKSMGAKHYAEIANEREITLKAEDFSRSPSACSELRVATSSPIPIRTRPSSPSRSVSPQWTSPASSAASSAASSLEPSPYLPSRSFEKRPDTPHPGPDPNAQLSIMQDYSLPNVKVKNSTP